MAESRGAQIRTPDQRLRVFVSSTLGELAEERKVVRAAIERLHLAPVMFELGARPHPPRELYRSYLEQSDVFVGIYGESYGWVAPEMEISGLEDEFVLSAGKPSLLYVLDPAPARDARLAALIGRIESEGRVSYKTFSDAEQLGEQLENDLALLLAERFARPLELPSGTVTLLFTDIEGSTRLLRQLGDRYRDVLEDHRRLLRAAFASNGGHEVGTEGDSFFVSFRTAKSGVAAAVAAQRALSEHRWPEGVQLRVRIGLHSGEPDAGGEHYVGLGVHRAARISAAGHGGQVLLSNATRELVEDDLPAGVTLRDVGAYRLKDLDRPEQLFQLIAEGLPAEFPPLKGERVATGLSRKAKAAAAAAVIAVIAAAVVVPLLVVGGNDGKTLVPANVLAAIDPMTGKVVDSIPVGTRPSDVAYGSGSLWVANVGDSTVTRVDPKTNEALRSISVPAPPIGLAAGSGAVWVASSDGSLRRIDPDFNSVADVRPAAKTFITSSVLPSPVAVGARSVWVAGNTEISQIDPATGNVVNKTPSGFSPSGIAIGSGSVWVAENTENEVTRIDLAGGATTAIPVGHGPLGVAVGAGSVWVTNSTDGTVTRIDPDTGSAQATISVGAGPAGIAVGGEAVWVADTGAGTVVGIDPKTDRVVRTIHVGESPTGVTVAGGRVWVSVQRNVSGIVAAGRGGVARVVLQSDNDFLNVDPGVANSTDVFQVLDATCAKLLNYPDQPAPAGEHLVPEVASALPTMSDGGKTYTFVIRSGYRFSPPSGEAVTAETFKTTIERTLSPAESTRLPAVSLDDVVGATAFEKGKARHVTGVVAKGNVLTIHLLQAAGDLPARLASPAFCAVPRATPANHQGVPGIPMAGPYYIAAYTPGRMLVLERNPNYHGPRPHHLAAIVYEIIPSSSEAVQDVEGGRADYFSSQFYVAAFPPSLIPRLRSRYGPDSSAAKKGQQQYFENPSSALGAFGISLNTSRPLFRDARLRRAVAYALDRSALAALDAKAFGAVRVTDQLLVPGFPGYRPVNVFTARPDLAAARRLAHGHGGVAVFYAARGQEQLVSIVQKDLARIGIQVVIRTFPIGVWLGKIRTRGEPYDLTASVANSGYADPASVMSSYDLSTIPLSNFSRLDDPVVTRRLRAAERLTGDARIRAYAQLDAELTRDIVPSVSYDYTENGDLLSARMGCEVYQPIYGMDLAALCLRK